MKATNVKEVLIAAKWILENKGWCQYSYAKDAEGTSCNTTSPRAACFCLSGALDVVEANEGLRSSAWGALHNRILVDELCKATSVIFFNDKPGRTKEEVLSLLDEVIKEAI